MRILPRARCAVSGPDVVRVVGAGVMGRGIAQVALVAGYRVQLCDARPDTVDEAASFVMQMIRRMAEKGQISEPDAASAVGRLESGVEIEAPDDAVGLVIEAVVERHDIKSKVLASLERALPRAVLATNTSSLSVNELAGSLVDGRRLIGLHFFNPVPLMKVVEVVPGLRTSEAAVQVAEAFVARIGHAGIRAQDTPGFLVNYLGRALPTEALALLAERAAGVEDIDAIVRECLGLRMGPFELLDLTGLDVSHPVMEIVSDGYYHEPRLRPSPLGRARLAAGLLGRKSGSGFYRYDLAETARPSKAALLGDPSTPLHVHANPELKAVLRTAGALLVDRPTTESVSVVSPWGEPAYRLATRAGLDPARAIGVDPLSLGSTRVTVMVPAAGDPKLLGGAVGALERAGRPAVLQADGPAPIAQRVLAVIVNLACAAAELGIGSPSDIELGARLGLGYPEGPLSMGDRVGPRRVVRVLDGLHGYTGDPRYRATPWLRTRAECGMSLQDKGTRPGELIDDRSSDVQPD